MMHARRMASILAGAMVTSLGYLVAASPATAHPSDFDTLTLDLLVGPRGLEVIDAALVASKGPGYEPFPSSQVKREVAMAVVAALDVEPDAVAVDAEMSERYHEVGFLVRFDEPSLGIHVPLQVETAELQTIAANQGVSNVKLSVCGVTGGAGSPDPGTLSDLDVQASRDARPAQGLDRAACEVWTLTTTDQSVSIVATPRRLADTGFSMTSAMLAALSLLFVGVALRALVVPPRR
jgi:hypothetical protein